MPEAIISAESTEAPTVRSGRFTVEIAKDGSDWQIDVLDENFCQPYDYQYLLNVNPTLDYPNKVADECEKWFRKLSEWGLLHGWHEGMYV